MLIILFNQGLTLKVKLVENLRKYILTLKMQGEGRVSNNAEV